MISGFVEFELLRGKNYPQSEDDPNPCTTQATVAVVDALTGASLSTAQLSSIQQNSNAPFYNDTLSFRVENAPENICFCITVREHSRKDAPFVLFHGKQLIGLSKVKAKHRFLIPLLSEEHAEQTEVGLDSLDLENAGTIPFLSARIHFIKDKILDTTDPYSDVDVSNKQISLNGINQLVPEGTQYVWLRLKTDKNWTNSYQYELLVSWRSRAPLEVETQATAKPRKGTTGGMAAAAAREQDSIRTVGDIITKKWCCHRTHQALTRVCITAEKYGKKITDLTFTPKEEVEFRTNKRERCVLLEQICKKRLEDTANSNLRDWLNRIWVLFVTGVDNDPAGPRVLSYEVRKAVHDAQFTEVDAIILQACLLFSLIPSLKYEACQALSESDYRAAPFEKLRELTGFEASQCSVTPSQEQFTHVFISFVGSLLETLTESEIVKAAAEFKSAVWDAQQRIAKGAKSTIGPHRRNYDAPILKGNGIHIEHLDKLGRRKQTPKFV
ncbi:hypothetical protein LSCM1_05860 [Leishmania martiniquensis]|uniref:C2 domain-containing protein n=1 Tax=Leishmania martiniquensis TaxID=1580590 RepID=A0A836HME5_9TRYP|nr:hypothetical protein LSCM1_05860 [Leishmania martiniquensis]